MADRPFKWEQLVYEYHVGGSPVPKPLIQITLAQWALESGWGKSGLAQDHNNFAGLKWRPERVGDIATAVDYTAHDGRTQYCKFNTVRDFITGYWNFIDRGPYDGWRRYLMDPEGFIRHLVKCGYCPDNGYVEKVLHIMNNDLLQHELDGTCG